MCLSPGDFKEGEGERLERDKRLRGWKGGGMFSYSRKLAVRVSSRKNFSWGGVYAMGFSVFTLITSTSVNHTPMHITTKPCEWSKGKLLELVVGEQ